MNLKLIVFIFLASSWPAFAFGPGVVCNVAMMATPDGTTFSYVAHSDGRAFLLPTIEMSDLEITAVQVDVGDAIQNHMLIQKAHKRAA